MRYKHVSVLVLRRKAIQGDIKLPTENGDSRPIRATPDWGESAINGDHLWTATSASGDLCYVGESECSKHGPRMKCPACKITVHAGCVSILSDKMKFQCKPTFKDVGIRQYREQTVIQHHWVHRRYEKGRCQQCGKSFQSKLSFGSKEIVAISCTWCKTAYHNKESCFSMQRIGEQCDLGVHMDIIVPPSWIVKLPRKGSFKSSIRRSPKKRASTKKKSRKEGCGEKDAQRAFAIKPIPCASSKPLLVFINPKSGGNQGAKMMQKFQWLLNPRQVFDLSQGGPSQGLELYRKVSNLRILACGGDGTAGWILSVLDEIGVTPPPPVAVLPLGTGNDLARSLGWGGGYTDEPISKILQNVLEGDIVQLDRWDLIVHRNPEVDISQCEEGKEVVPLNVVNNYFSIGVDAHIALEFHEAREAHPERFNSRLKNKMFYGQAGGKDLLQRKWKDLCNYVTLECDGQDYTGKLREHKVHSILFLNIPSYGGGTRPWGNPGTTFESPQTDDGLIEVIGLTIYQMPFLQAGGHGTCLCQCRSARVVTSKTIPVQVDGEPCRLLPSYIQLSMRNKACLVAKAKIHNQVPSHLPLEKLTIAIRKLNMADYENYHYDKERLRTLSTPIGTLSVNPDTDLENVRLLINQLCSLEGSDGQNLSPSKRFSPDWCFLDSCTAERFFRIDRAQEMLHYVVDISQDDVYILDPEQSPIAPEPPPPSLASPTPPLLASPPAAETPAIEGPAGSVLVELASSETLSSSASCAASADEAPLFGGVQEESAWSGPISKSEGGVSRFAPEQKSSTSNEIIVAAKMGDLLRLRHLCDGGQSLLTLDDAGMSTLHHAARYGHKDLVRYIVASAPSSILDITDREKGQTALHKAAAYKRRTICCMLVAAGASLSKEDSQGFTAKQLAAKAGDEDLAAYLESQEHFERLVQDRETAV
ncbi:eye-specific diacylglycerol kinase isoform X4 [Ixodes scapularis]|uniref:eye-specific diacylglycerol kinase isoform X4 n=1 Tax=Ixodes scapularis TaxID=6945 RepID=UPI001A9F3A21|nr:eye-specific diacylglycerol kinase isoform X4 [Ixodes scapularis]